MAGKIYALLVGINEYQGGVRGLSGCVNDVRNVSEFLRRRTEGGEYELHELLLTSGDRTNPGEQKPTRQAVIDGFRRHLRRAGPDDIAFFYYSGHGSQEPAPPEFWRLEPDRLNETLVCYDSRTEGGFDLADKEIAVLLSEVAEHGAQVITIFDSCHSGSISRDLDTVARMTPADNRVRPVQSYLGFESIVSSPAVSAAEAASRVWFEVPRGRHVVFSACRPEELAQERFIDDDVHGVMSYYLLDALQRTSGALTYRDLYARLAAHVRNRAASQNPTLETADAQELDRPFLGGAIRPQPPYFSLTRDNKAGWTIDGGAVHGIAGPRDGETTVLAYVRDDVDLVEVRRQADTLGLARVTRVEAGRSLVTLEPAGGVEPNAKDGYRAFVVSLPVPPLIVRMEGDAAGLALVRDALMRAGSTGGPSGIVREAASEDEGRAADLVLAAREQRYLIRRADDAYPLMVPVDEGYTAGAAEQAVERLQRIARWLQVDRLDNKTSGLPRDAVKMELFSANPDSTLGERLEVKEGALRFEYRKEGDRWVAPAFKIKLTNTTNRRLYAALLDLTEDFGIDTQFLLPGGGQWLEPKGAVGSEVWAQNGGALEPAIEESLRAQGVVTFRDTLKLVVSTTEAPGTLLEQPALDVTTRSLPSFADVPETSLARLFQHLQTRGIRPKAPPQEEIADWTTSQITFTTVHPLDTVEVPRPGQSAPLSGAVTVEGHPALKASLRLTTQAEGARDTGNLALPRVFTDHPELAGPFEFTSSRSGEPGASVLELEVADESYKLVTPQQPLVLNADVPLGADEAVLPVAYDPGTGLFLPLGRAQSVDGATRITIERLPEPMGTRDLKGSIKLFFQKVIAEKLGIGESDVCRLAAATVEHGKPVHYEASVEAVKARVAAAERIVLYIHGITGDTRGMAGSAAGLPPGVQPANPPPALGPRYDLVLTFDYESFNTSIEETALKLKEHLKAVGLAPGHGKTLHIVSHSLGTQVTRWFIEREAGHRVVQKAVLAAPPNAGTPWAKVEDLALMALGAAINGLASLIWPPAAIPALVGVLASAVGVVEKVDTSMDELKPGSLFYKQLNASEDPCIPYGVIVGNTSKIPAAAAEVGLIEKLSEKLTSVETRKALAAAVFFGKPNDTAVSVASMMALPPGRNPAPVFVELPLDHCSYFTTPEGLAALAELLPA